MGYFTRVNFFTRTILIGILLVASAMPAFSVGAYPHILNVEQPDGSVVSVQTHGDEWYNWISTTDGYRLLKSNDGYLEYASQLKSGEVVPSGIKASNPDKRSSAEMDFLSSIPKKTGISQEDYLNKRREIFSPQLKSAAMTTHFPSQGESDLLVILANFSNTQPTFTPNDFDAFMNEPDYNDTGSFRDYYLEVSQGLLTINSTISQWVELTGTHDYYGPENKWKEFALQAVQEAAAAGVDFSKFDNDGDGVVEGLAIIHQGAGQEVTGDTNDIWSHSYSFSAWGIAESERTFNGVVVDQYTVQPEWRSGAADMNTIGVICHEFGHNLGLLDFYDVNEEHYDGTGDWDIMASGTYNGSPHGSSPAHHNPFSKQEMGWVNITSINDASKIELHPIQSSGQVLRINSPVENEYLLLENRQRTGFDAFIPNRGMLVYHVDSNLIAERRATNTVNVDEHQGMYPIAAGGFINNPSCPFPGSDNVTELTDTSTPAMETWDGQPFNRSITSIEMTNEVISFNFMAIQDGSPIKFNASVVDEQGIDLSWTLSSENYPVLMAWSPDGVFGDPVAGQIYSAGDQITGGGTVLFYGNSPTTYLHGGLQPSTQCYYSVWSDKGDIYSQSLKDSGQTRSAPVSKFPWTDGFESGVSKWYQDHVSGNVSWNINPPEGTGFSIDPFADTSFASFFAASTTAPSTRLISPMFNLETDKSYYLKFRHFQAEWDGDQDELTVLIRKENSEIWEEIAHYNDHISEWAEKRIKIPYSQPLEIAFMGTANYGHGIGIDEVMVYEATSCAVTPDVSASAISATNVTKTSMDLDWVRGNGDAILVVARKDTAIFELPDHGTAYSGNAEFGSGDQLAEGTYVVYNGQGTEVTLSGLEHTSEYHFSFFEYSATNYCYENQAVSASFSSAPNIYDIAVAVKDADGTALENAMVRFMQDTLFTNASGEISLQVTHSDLYRRLNISKDSFTAKSERFIADTNKTINITLNPFTPLAPYNLSGNKDYKSIGLTWDPVIHENFDHYHSFSLEIDGWTFIDKDGAPTYGIKNMTWTNELEPMAFMVFGVHDEEVLQMEYNISSWSGDKVLAAFAAQGVQSDDWVISPEFTVKESDFFSFMARSLDYSWGPEVINVHIRPAGETVWTTLYQGIDVPEAWSRYEYDLQNYVDQRVQVAVQNNGNETFMLLLDDFRIGPELGPLNTDPMPSAPSANVKLTKRDVSPAEKKSKRKSLLSKANSTPSLYAGNIEYVVYRDETAIARVHGFANTLYTDEVAECLDYNYTVSANFPDVNLESERTLPLKIEACYSVLFVITNESGNFVEGAEVTFNNMTMITDAYGEAFFTGVSDALNQTYKVAAVDYSELTDSISVINDTTLDISLKKVSTNINNTDNWSDKTVFIPNPVVSKGTIQGLPQGIYHLEIFDITGQLIGRQRVTGGHSVEYDFSSYRPGIYMMIVKSTDGKTSRMKIVKRNNK